MTDFSSETIQAKRQWSSVFKIVKEKNSARIHLEKIFFKKCFQNEGKIKTIVDIKNVKAALQERLKEALSGKRKLTPDRNMNLLKGMVSTTSRYIKFLLLFKHF